MRWNHYTDAVNACQCLTAEGRVVKVVGLIVEGLGPGKGVGSICVIHNAAGEEVRAEVVGFKNHRIILMPYGEMRGISPGCKITLVDERPYVPVGDAFLGRVVNGLGEPIDGKGAIPSNVRYPLYGNVVNPMERRPIREVADVGIGAINAFITIGKGQRMAIMAGSGVGKSVLMGMIVRHTTADVSVIALIGERGREVKDFVEQNLGQEGLKRSIVVAATSDVSPLIRMRGAYLATTIAEYFRDRGLDVILVMDSISRFAMSCRDVGLAAGEPPTVKGYTPSFFFQLPKLLERAGSIEGKGSITGIYTVLVEGDDINDPVGDATRAIVDGHIVLSRKLANRGHYPAIDVLASVSRVMRDVVDPEHLKLAEKIRDIMATYSDAEDLIAIGAYVDGSDPKIDYAKSMIDKINAFLKQDVSEQVSFRVGINRVKEMLQGPDHEKV
ncbi:MAG: FliI/YscN family ATPase [Deltaproteobacteria bacterium]|nr:FliI/YscN family ATPase [Deltaproteobacteria bacterium]MBW2018954.1 FliI/YscN family ATPase [Deltaproteobacteria bacterium]MBW2073169.1 FliI/YscN family ATPase [Deltaproteobacteria bacterium]RLB83789.1 MAG: flagellum-specific ATP synthase FliI [Deltaproteobacteria bacterium]